MTLLAALLLSGPPGGVAPWEWTYGFPTPTDTATDDASFVAWNPNGHVSVSGPDGKAVDVHLPVTGLFQVFVGDGGKIAALYGAAGKRRIGVYDPATQSFVWSALTASPSFTPCQGLAGLGTAEGVYAFGNGAFKAARPGTLYAALSNDGFVIGPNAVQRYDLETGANDGTVLKASSDLYILGSKGDRFGWLSSDGKTVTVCDATGKSIFFVTGDDSYYQDPDFSYNYEINSYSRAMTPSRNGFQLDQRTAAGFEGDEDSSEEYTLYRMSDGGKIDHWYQDDFGDGDAFYGLLNITGWRKERAVHVNQGKYELYDGASLVRTLPDAKFGSKPVFSPDGGTVHAIAGSYEGFWLSAVSLNASSGSLVKKFDVPTDFASSGYYPDGTLWAYEHNGTFTTYKSDGTVKNTASLVAGQEAAVFPDGTKVVHTDTGVTLYPPTGPAHSTKIQNVEPFDRLSLSPRGNRIALGPNVVYLPSAGAKLLVPKGQPGFVVYGAKDGSYAVVAGSYVRVYDKNANLLQTIEDWDVQPVAVALSPDGKMVAILDQQGSLTFTPVKSGHVLARYDYNLPDADQSDVLAFSPDSKRLALTGTDGILRLMAVPTSSHP